jgi:FHA domain
MQIRLRGCLFVLLCLALLSSPAGAQSGAVVRLYAPDASAFPRLTAYLDLHNAQGEFIDNLQTSQVNILEGDNTVPVIGLDKLHPGVQVVVAINPGPSFAIRNAQAVSRYDVIKGVLTDWANSRQGSTIDDWSYLITGGTAVSHTSDPARWLAGLAADSTDTRNAQPSLDTLSKAVALASDPTNRPGMGRAVLFITAPIEGQFDQALKDISDLAIQQGVHIYIWMVASSGAMITQSAQKLLTLVGFTAGQSFIFTGDETVPSPEVYLEELRSIYQLTYVSKASNSGEHQFSAQVQLDGGPAQSNQVTFQVDLQPPQPAFISPPISIERQIPKNTDKTQNIADSPDKNPDDLLIPRDLALQVVFDFPDGRIRDLTRSALLVDGVVVAQNQAAPFDRFTWNLSNYTADGLHKLQVQTTDVLGLTGTSIEVPVQITVEHPESDPMFTVKRNLPIISAIIVLLSGSLLFLVLVLGGQLHPGPQRALRSRFKKDPLTQPIHMADDVVTPRKKGWRSRFPGRAQAQEAPRALAFLSPISDADTPVDSSPIPITSDEVLLGSDPHRANLILDDPCIEGLHARLVQEGQGVFRLTDEGSIAGTWVNYTPIDQRGVILQHGDLVHLGRLGFRFSCRQPAQVRKPVVTLASSPETAAEEPELAGLEVNGLQAEPLETDTLDVNDLETEALETDQPEQHSEELDP